jgi:hypothetical protein
VALNIINQSKTSKMFASAIPPTFEIKFPQIYSCLLITIRRFTYHCGGLNRISGIMARMLASERAVVGVIVWLLGFQLPVQTVPITSKVVSSNPAHGEVYSIQHYVRKCVSDLRQVGSVFHLLTFTDMSWSGSRDISGWLIGWLMFNVQRAIFQLYSGREHLNI